MNNISGIFVFAVLASAFLQFGCSKDTLTQVESNDGVKISFSNLGKGETAIILVHGWTNNNTIWDLQVPALSEKYQVIAIDLAGHGKSGNDRADWSMTAFGEDIAAVIKAVDLDHAILVGFSLGGPAILEAAKIVPDRIDGLILIDAIHNPDHQRSTAEMEWVDSTFMDLIEHPSSEN